MSKMSLYMAHSEMVVGYGGDVIRFKVSENMDEDSFVVILISKPILVIAKFPFDNYLKSNARGLAEDYCDFLNDKYLDKKINEEWGKADIESRIKYHKEQIFNLKNGRTYWNRHGNGVGGDVMS